MNALLPFPPSVVLSKSCTMSRSYVSKASKVFDYRPARVVTAHGTFTQVINPDRSEDTISDYSMNADTVDDPVLVVQPDDGVFEQSSTTEAAAQQRFAKHERQWRKWSEDIIPALLKPYMALLRETNSLRDRNRASGHLGCVGCVHGRILDVSCIYFDSMVQYQLSLVLI